MRLLDSETEKMTLALLQVEKFFWENNPGVQAEVAVAGTILSWTKRGSSWSLLIDDKEIGHASRVARIKSAAGVALLWEALDKNAASLLNEVRDATRILDAFLAEQRQGDERPKGDR